MAKKRDKRTNNDLQNIAHKTKDRVTPLRTLGWTHVLHMVISSCSISGRASSRNVPSVRTQFDIYVFATSFLWKPWSVHILHDTTKATLMFVFVFCKYSHNPFVNAVGPEWLNHLGSWIT
jgi:hypothetical protein